MPTVISTAMAVPANQTEDVKSRLLRSALFMLLLHLISNTTAPTINEAMANKAGMSHSIWLSVFVQKIYTREHGAPSFIRDVFGDSFCECYASSMYFPIRNVSLIIFGFILPLARKCHQH